MGAEQRSQASKSPWCTVDSKAGAAVGSSRRGCEAKQPPQHRNCPRDGTTVEPRLRGPPDVRGAGDAAGLAHHEQRLHALLHGEQGAGLGHLLDAAQRRQRGLRVQAKRGP